MPGRAHLERAFGHEDHFTRFINHVPRFVRSVRRFDGGARVVRPGHDVYSGGCVRAVYFNVGPRLLRRVEQLEEVRERLPVLALVFEDELEDVAAARERVGGVEVEAVEAFERAQAHAPQVVFHLAPRGQVLRVLARRPYGVEDALVALVGRGQAPNFLQQPVGLEDPDVREVPDDGAVTEAGAAAQVALFRHVEEAQRLGARPRQGQRDLFGSFVHRPFFELNAGVSHRGTEAQRKQKGFLYYPSLLYSRASVPLWQILK